MLELIEYTHMLRVTKTFVKRNVEVLTAHSRKRISFVKLLLPYGFWFGYQLSKRCVLILALFSVGLYDIKQSGKPFPALVGFSNNNTSYL